MANINDYGFPFPSVEGDRQYGSAEWRDYFGSLIKDGIIQNKENECRVKQQVTPSKSVFVDTGAVFIKGAMYILDAPKTLAITENTSGNARIDRIVARLDVGARKIDFAVLKGVPASSPVAKTLTRTSTIWELGLADITLANGYSTITDVVIDDKRMDVDLCGASSMTIGVIPPSGLDALTVKASQTTANAYGVLLANANVDDLLQQVRNAKFYGKYAEMGGGEEKITSGESKVLYSTTLNNDLSMASLSNSRLIVPAKATRVKVYSKARLTGLRGSAQLNIYKNGVFLDVLALVNSSGTTVNLNATVEATYFSTPIECVEGDYFELYSNIAFEANPSSVAAGSTFGIEVLR